MLGRKTVFGVSGKQLARHVLAEFFRARVRIVIGTVPLNRAIFRHDFVAALARDCDRADFAEAPQPVIVLRMPRQCQHFQRAAQIHIQTAFFRLPVQRRRAMNHRIRRMHQPVVFIAVQTEAGRSQVSAKNSDLGLQVFVEAREIADATATRATSRPCASCGSRARTSRFSDAPCRFEQIGGDVRADVSGRPGQEYRHVAPFVPVFTAISVGGHKLKGARRPRFQRTPFNQRIRPAPQRRNVNVDPVFPPVEPARVVPERLLLFRHQRVRKLLDIIGGKIMLVAAE